MRRSSNGKASNGGYSLIEVMVASTLLAIGVAAASVISLTMASQEEINHRVSRALHLQEGASRLYQLGLSTQEIDALIPNDPTIRGGTTGTIPVSAPYTTLSWAESVITDATYGSFEEGICTMNFRARAIGSSPAGSWSAGADTSATMRSEVLRVVRPVIR
jgi:prepilin-type N-terminal cleavage/methylation domain-containing protein